MTLLDQYLTNVAKAMAGETHVTPSHLAVGSVDMSPISTTETSLNGQLNGRYDFNISRNGTTVDFVGLRPGSDVIDTTNGDPIKTVASFSDATSGEMLTALAVSGITQTTAFDYEFILTVQHDRE